MDGAESSATMRPISGLGVESSEFDSGHWTGLPEARGDRSRVALFGVACVLIGLVVGLVGVQIFSPRPQGPSSTASVDGTEAQASAPMVNTTLTSFTTVLFFASIAIVSRSPAGGERFQVQSHRG